MDIFILPFLLGSLAHDAKVTGLDSVNVHVSAAYVAVNRIVEIVTLQCI